MINPGIRSGTGAVLTLVLTGLLGACAHVGQEQFDTELESLRRQMEEADRTHQERVNLVRGRSGLACGVSPDERNAQGDGRKKKACSLHRPI